MHEFNNNVAIININCVRTEEYVAIIIIITLCYSHGVMTSHILEQRGGSGYISSHN